MRILLVGRACPGLSVSDQPLPIRVPTEKKAAAAHKQPGGGFGELASFLPSLSTFQYVSLFVVGLFAASIGLSFFVLFSLHIGISKFDLLYFHLTLYTLFIHTSIVYVTYFNRSI